MAKKIYETKDGNEIFWSNAVLGPLSGGERKAIAVHERMHLEYVKANMSPEEIAKAEAAIKALEEGKLS